MSRIDHYDGKNVTFHYQKHEDNSLVYETISAVEFIKRLIRHIPDKYFHMIRYYGIYSRVPKHFQDFLFRFPKACHHIHKIFSTWRFQMQMAFKVDPLWCEKCNCRLSFVSLQFTKSRGGACGFSDEKLTAKRQKPLNEICLNSGASP